MPDYVRTGHYVLDKCNELDAQNKNLRAALENEYSAHRGTKQRVKELEHNNRCLEAVGAQRLDELWAADARNDVQAQETSRLQGDLGKHIDAHEETKRIQKAVDAFAANQVALLKAAYKDLNDARDSVAGHKNTIEALKRMLKRACAKVASLEKELTDTREDLANTELAHAATMTKLNGARVDRDRLEKACRVSDIGYCQQGVTLRKTEIKNQELAQTAVGLQEALDEARKRILALERLPKLDENGRTVLRFKASVIRTTPNRINLPFNSSAHFRIKQTNLCDYMNAGGVLSASLMGSVSLHDKLDPDKDYDITISESPS